ncbi:hypothetical protein BC628DRAFT_750799 [Trametes gibbosa]|nr:hypothetical protein BC628DRAFT_750799 [Trametes gibbosa]
MPRSVWGKGGKGTSDPTGPLSLSVRIDHLPNDVLRRARAGRGVGEKRRRRRLRRSGSGSGGGGNRGLLSFEQGMERLLPAPQRLAPRLPVTRSSFPRRPYPPAPSIHLSVHSIPVFAEARLDGCATSNTRSLRPAHRVAACTTYLRRCIESTTTLNPPRPKPHRSPARHHVGNTPRTTE